MKNIAVVCGGYSGERVVSMRSAAMVMENMDRSKFHPIQIVIEEFLLSVNYINSWI